MATAYSHIIPEQADLIRSAPLSFVASVDPGLGAEPDGIGPVNLSPKVGVPRHILRGNRLVLATLVRYLPVGIKTYRILKAVVDRIGESTPQERESIGRNLLAIYQILRGVAVRRQEEAPESPLPMLPLAQGHNSQESDGIEQHRRFHQSMRQFTQAIRRYRRSFTREEGKAIVAHLTEIGKIVAEIERRTNSPTTRKAVP